MRYLLKYLHGSVILYLPTLDLIASCFLSFQLVCDAVLTAAGQIHQSFYQNEEFKLDISSIHYSYSLIQGRLINFSELVHVFPDLVKKLLALRARLDVGEMVSHIYLLAINKRGMIPKFSYC